MVILLGDIHGQFKKIKNIIEQKQIGNSEEITYIIQVGDFGIGFDDRNDIDSIISLNEFFKSRNIILLAIRGNHDDPKYFNGDHIYTNLKLLKDYTVMEIEGNKYLFVGGAVSIDRNLRLSSMQEYASYGEVKKLYWFDEPFYLDKEKISNIENIDVVITHTAPEWCYPDNRQGFGDFVESFSYQDSNLLSDLKNERDLVTEMFRLLKDKSLVKLHYYGHFHSSEITLNGMTFHCLLNIDEFRILDKI